MARVSTLADVHLDVAPETKFAVVIEPESPFRILVAGDFSGGAGRIRKPVNVDRDNFDEVLALFGPELSLELGGARLPIRFNALDDFHPDHLYRVLPPFESLRNLRRRVLEGSAIPPAAPRTEVSGADLLRQMMGEGAAPASAAAARSEWERMIHDMAAQYTVSGTDLRQPEMLAQTDAAITAEMRAVLHHRDFQSLESAWRALFFLIRRLPTDENLKVYVLDLPPAELASADGLALLRRIAVDEAIVPWSLMAATYSFAPEHESTLVQIAAIARSANAPFLAGVASEVVGLARVFDTLRHSADAPWVGLAMPRFLLRLPYGAETVPTEDFAFEEMPAPVEHERYLWGPPAIACAYLLGDTWSRYGWKMRPGVISRIDDLPLHVYNEAGESLLKPCAEVLLTDEAAELLLERGFIPLVSMKDSDRVRVARFQSVADPPATLAGPWS